MMSITASNRSRTRISAVSNLPLVYISVELTNSYSNPKRSRNLRSIALLCSPKLAYSVSNGLLTRVSGRPSSLAIFSLPGTLSGTLRRPSMSSENANNRVGTSLSSENACRTMLVRATSPNVPICGNPEGP